jgi:hypothetical protein
MTNSKRKTAENLHISRSGLIKWINNREIIFDKNQRIDNRKISNSSSRRKSEYPENENRLFEWFQSRRDNQIAVTSFQLQQEMLNLMNRFPVENNLEKKFQASYGWVRKFMRRNDLVIRRLSGSGRGFPSNCQNIVQEFVREVNTKIAGNNLTTSQIFNFDESSFYMCSPGNYTIDYRGTKKSYAKTCGKEKVRLSCLMCGSADGKKLPVLCVVPRKKQIPDLELDENIIIIYETEGNDSRD